ncbi:hypothetical protein JCM10213_004510 [Rhodosporidiobolus nylandii]
MYLSSRQPFSLATVPSGHVLSYAELISGIDELVQKAYPEGGRAAVQTLVDYRGMADAPAAWQHRDPGQKALISNNLRRAYLNLLVGGQLPPWQQVAHGRVPLVLETQYQLENPQSDAERERQLQPVNFPAPSAPSSFPHVDPRMAERALLLTHGRPGDYDNRHPHPPPHQSAQSVYPHETVRNPPAFHTPLAGHYDTPFLPSQQHHGYDMPATVPPPTHPDYPFHTTAPAPFPPPTSIIPSQHDDVDWSKPDWLSGRHPDDEHLSLARAHRRIGLRTAKRLGTTCEAFQRGF